MTDLGHGCHHYRVIADGWVAGRRVRRGEVILMHPTVARYEPVELVKASAKGPSSPASKTGAKPAPEAFDDRD